VTQTTRLEREGVKKKGYADLDIWEIAKCENVRGVTATLSDSEKLHYRSPTVCVDRTENSWKYGSEVQIVAWTVEKPTVESRIEGPQAFHRVEICLPRNEAIKLFESALRKLWLLE
jgi:hypothetical protein